MGTNEACSLTHIDDATPFSTTSPESAPPAAPRSEPPISGVTAVMRTVESRSVLVIRPFLAAAAARGVDTDAILAELGVDRAKIADDAARLEASLACRVIIRLGERLPGVPLGLVAAESVCLGLFEDATVSARTVREAAAAAACLYGLLDDASDLVVEEEGAWVSFAIVARPGTIRLSVLSEFALATIARIVREGTGRELYGSEVRLAERGTTDERVYAQFFRANVIFGAARPELRFPRAIMALELPGARAARHDALRRRADHLLAQPSVPGSFMDRVRQATSHAISAGSASLRDVAARLETSGRTLQRRLHEHGTSFETILDETRRDLAVHLVANADIPILHVARRVGFGDAGAFSRAFRRWTAQTPTHFRAAANG